MRVLGRFCLRVLCLAVFTTHCCAGDLLVSSRFSNNVLRYDSQSGAFLGVFASGNGLANPNGIAYGPDGNLYVGLGDTGSVMRFQGQTGSFLGEFVAGGAGGLQGCRAISFGPDGNLYVDNGPGNNVLRYDGISGSFLGIAAEGHGMSGPVGLTFGPDGNLYVGAALSNTVDVFTPTGDFVRALATASTHRQATGVLFNPAGALLVGESVTNEVVRLNAQTGALLGIAALGGGLSTPINMIFSPAGDLLVGSFGTNSVLRYSASTGGFLGTFIAPGSGGLNGTHNMVYMPVPAPGGFALLGATGVFAWRRTRKQD